MKQKSVFASKVFLTGVVAAILQFGKPTLESLVKERNFNLEKHGLPALYLVASITYSAWLRYATDAEGVSYTPNGMVGRNKEEEKEDANIT